MIFETQEMIRFKLAKTLKLRSGLIALSMLLLGCPNVTFVPPAGDVIFHDEFSAATLDPGWTFIGADASKTSLAERPGFLRVDPQTAPITCDNQEQSYVLRDLDGDFIVQTRMSFEAAFNLSAAGIAVQDDQGRTVSLSLFSISGVAGTFRGVILAALECPAPTPRHVQAKYAAIDVYLRLQRTGNSFTGSFSSDGTTFTVVGTLTVEMSNNVQVGIGIANGVACEPNCDQLQPADFDFFELSRPVTGN